MNFGVKLKRTDGETAAASYEDTHVSDETDFFRLNLGKFNIECGTLKLKDSLRVRPIKVIMIDFLREIRSVGVIIAAISREQLTMKCIFQRETKITMLSPETAQVLTLFMFKPGV